MLPSVKCCRSTVLVRALPHAREVAPALVLPHVAQDAARRPPLALTTVPRGIVYTRPLKLKETRKAPA